MKAETNIQCKRVPSLAPWAGLFVRHTYKLYVVKPTSTISYTPTHDSGRRQSVENNRARMAMELTLKDFEPVSVSVSVSMKGNYLNVSYFTQDSFVLERYVEKLTQLDPTTGMGPLARKEGMAFDAKVLHESFQVSACVRVSG